MSRTYDIRAINSIISSSGHSIAVVNVVVIFLLYWRLANVTNTNVVLIIDQRRQCLLKMVDGNQLIPTQLVHVTYLPSNS